MVVFSIAELLTRKFVQGWTDRSGCGDKSAGGGAASEAGRCAGGGKSCGRLARLA